jgi:hypothetical protein
MVTSSIGHDIPQELNFRHLKYICLVSQSVQYSDLYIMGGQSLIYETLKRWDSTVGIVTGYGFDGQGFRVQVPEGARFSLFYVIQTGSAAHPATCPMGMRGSYPGSKAAGACS